MDSSCMAPIVNQPDPRFFVVRTNSLCICTKCWSRGRVCVFPHGSWTAGCSVATSERPLGLTGNKSSNFLNLRYSIAIVYQFQVYTEATFYQQLAFIWALKVLRSYRYKCASSTPFFKRDHKRDGAWSTLACCLLQPCIFPTRSKGGWQVSNWWLGNTWIALFLWVITQGFIKLTGHESRSLMRTLANLGRKWIRKATE
jgi:hypothetical protein